MDKSFIILCACVTLLYLPDSLARSCFEEGHNCNPEYLCPCCNKLYFEDGTDQGLTDNYGYFCNMQDAVLVPESPGFTANPYLTGCCQRCTTEGEGCTQDIRPCCPDHNPVPDSECGGGSTKCERKNKTLVYKDEAAVYGECTGKLPSCYGEGKYCSGSLWKCCQGLTCDKADVNDDWGVCKRTGSEEVVTVSPIDLNLPIAPLDPTCPLYMSTTATPQTEAPTTAAPATGGETTTKAASNCGNGQSCQIEGGYCDSVECCPGLECPDNWLILLIIRWILNRFGIWYRVCRDYAPFQWYNPFTWIAY